jgi:chaperonin cofactor prefoldin
MMYLNKGLELADGLGDLDLKASLLCNVGNVLMQIDQEKALAALEQAVELREKSVRGERPWDMAC